MGELGTVGAAPDVSETLRVTWHGLAYVGVICAKAVAWLAGEGPITQVKLAGALVAFFSIFPNWQAFREVRASIISCSRVLNFTGLGIGPSTEFVVPMRALLFSYVLYLFYQVVSQAVGLFGTPSWSDFGIDLAVQTILFTTIAAQFVAIRRKAQRSFKNAGVKFERFLGTFDHALRGQHLSMTGLAVSTFVLPFAALVPKFVELAIT